MSKKQPKFVAISSQKGGVGKSTITSIVCSYLHYEYKYNVAVIDCDECQASITKMRERDREVSTSSPEGIESMKEYFIKVGKKAYPIRQSTLSGAISRAKKLIEEEEMEFDFIFFDFPGSVGPSAMLPTVADLDYIISPIIADIYTLESTLSFARLLIDHIINMGDQKLKSIHLFWNQVDGRESSNLYEVYDEYLKKENISLMEVYLPKQVRFSKEQTFNKGAFFRSSYFIPSKSYREDSNIEAFVAELLQIINPQE